MTANVGNLKATLSLDTGAFAAGAGKVKTEIKGLKDSAATASRDLRSAAGANANLVSQFNDIGVMLAAGQSPLQLALQQGTQISQVLTQMGGGVGALRALGSAFVGMLNPVSLATIGVIGFGAAAIQWLMPAQEEAGKTRDAFEALKDSMSSYNDALSLSLLYTGDAEKKYGDEAQKGAEIARRIMTIEAEKTRSSISGILSKAYSDMGFDAFGERGISGAGRIESSNLAEAAGNLGFKSSWSDTLFGYGGISQENLALAEKLGNAMREINRYVAQPIPEGGLDDYLVGLRQRLDDYTAQLNALKKAGADEGALNAINEKMVPLQQALLEGEAKRAAIRAADAAKAEELLATLESQLAMNQLIAEHGKESLQVRQAELDAEFEKQAAAIEGLNITDAQKDALYDALAALHDNESQTLAWADAMAQVNAELQGAYSLISAIGGGMVMNARINAARAVRDAGGNALDARRAGEIAGRKQEILNGRDTFGSEYFGMSDAELQGHLDQVDIDAGQQDAWRDLTTEARRSSRRSGGKRGRRGGRGGRERQNEYQRSVADMQGETAAYQRQAEAIAQVTAAGGDWEHALSVIEEEQKLLTAAQKAGVEITPEVRKGITDMAEAYVDAEEKLESLRDATDRGQDAFRGLFGSVLEGADAAKDAIANLLAEIAKVQFAKGALGVLGATSWGSSLISTVGGLMSFDGGGDTPDGPRSGGLDGKGGFLAMMHPRERVQDLTRGQGGALGIAMEASELTLSDDGKIMASVQARIVQAQAGSVQRSVQVVSAMNKKTKNW
ncbi:phage tail length tape measure family protein [Paracoccus sp. CPCC 101403]|uniref:Phage tail length tape measure family protein n=1 Tax=Paracoccus broussonetiae TaxID=3075834 RepID=A0ABU3ECF3_9RHOB|nr:phage tail length tape measure family protein [Paracoccus sp. CPCC 101403]MDT1061905.1 phage tail length tape measure family protein [Paracoccus sp. CPCC 101403]